MKTRGHVGVGFPVRRSLRVWYEERTSANDESWWTNLGNKYLSGGRRLSPALRLITFTSLPCAIGDCLAFSLSLERAFGMIILFGLMTHKGAETTTTRPINSELLTPKTRNRYRSALFAELRLLQGLQI